MVNETKDLLILMVTTWNQFNVNKKVDAEIERNEFSPGHWAIDLSISGVVHPEFVLYLLPAIIARNCIWFLSGSNDHVVFHIQ